MTELDVWQTYNMGQSAAGAQFIGVAFLAWVALRVALNIRNNEDANLLLKLAGTGFCLSVAYFIAINTGWYEWNNNSIAAGLAYLQSTDVAISPVAQSFVENMDPGAAFNLVPNLAQGVFIASLLIMQLGSIWLPKK